MTSGAVDAILRLAHRFGINRLDPIVLSQSHHVSIRLFPLDVVARIATSTDEKAVDKIARELNIARHLIENVAPIVGPSNQLPAGPHVENGFALSFWEFVPHIAADEDNAEHVALAAKALKRVHQALSTFRGELPDFWLNIDRCRRLLENESELTELRPADRAFLLATFNHLRARLTELSPKFTPIHGDAHLGNVFITPEGARWSDLEDVCLGPRERDLCSFPETDLDQFEPLNRDLLSTLRFMSSLCVSVWCWQTPDIPEKRAAAEYHLDYLKKAYRF